MIKENGEKKVSYITEDTIIKGDVNTSSDLIVKGKILGNLVSSNDVEVRGMVQGDVKANNVNVANSQIVGNVTCMGNFYVDKESNIDGNIISAQAKVAGQIKGKLDIARSVEILSTGNVEGDINAESIAIEHGAAIKGFVNIEKKVEPVTSTPISNPYQFPKADSYSNATKENVDVEENLDFVEEL